MNALRHVLRERLSRVQWKLLAGVALYALPSVAIIVEHRHGPPSFVPGPVVRVFDTSVGPFSIFCLALACSIVVGGFVSVRVLLRDDTSQRTNYDSPDPLEWSHFSWNRTALLAEYEQLGQEARYRDRLIIRTNYFTLVVFAAFVSIYVNVPLEVRPLITLIGSVVAFVFTTALASYTGARNELRDRQSELESLTDSDSPLGISRTLRARDRSGTAQIDMSKLIIRLHQMLTLALTVWYVFTIFLTSIDYQPFVLPPS